MIRYAHSTWEHICTYYILFHFHKKRNTRQEVEGWNEKRNKRKFLSKYSACRHHLRAKCKYRRKRGREKCNMETGKEWVLPHRRPTESSYPSLFPAVFFSLSLFSSFLLPHQKMKVVVVVEQEEENAKKNSTWSTERLKRKNDENPVEPFLTATQSCLNRTNQVKGKGRKKCDRKEELPYQERNLMITIKKKCTDTHLPSTLQFIFHPSLSLFHSHACMNFNEDAFLRSR